MIWLAIGIPGGYHLRAAITNTRCCDAVNAGKIADYSEALIFKNEEGTVISEQVIKRATDRLVAGFHPDRVILFGSQARGTADERSDVDLLVVCPFSGRRRSLMVAMDRALRGLGFARDVIVLTPEEFERDRHIPGTIARPAWLEGKVLYERSR